MDSRSTIFFLVKLGFSCCVVGILCQSERFSRPSKREFKINDIYRIFLVQKETVRRESRVFFLGVR